MPERPPTEPAIAREILSFGNFRLDPAAHELLRDGEEVAIAPKSLACLVYLLTHRHRAVGRDELVENIWGHSHISDGALSQTILQLRRLLGDADDTQYIKSIRGFGYRWIAVTQASTASENSGPDLPSAGAEFGEPSLSVVQIHARTTSLETTDGNRRVAPPERVANRRIPLVLAGAALVMLIVLLATYMQRDPPSSSGDATDESALVLVLPIEVDKAESSWLRLGGMDMLATHLRTAGLRVVPVETVLQLLATDVDAAPEGRVRRLVEATGSTVVLRTTVRRVEHRWAVHVREIAGAAARPPLRAEADDALDALRHVLHPLALELGVADEAAMQADAHLQRLRYRVQAASLDKRYEEALQLISEAPSELREHPELLYAEASLHFRRRALPLALRHFEQLLQRPELAADAALRLRAQAGMAVTLAASDEIEQARALMQALVQDPRIENDSRLAGYLHLNLAVMAAGSGQRPDARAALLSARRLLTGSGDIQGLARLDLASGLFEAQEERQPDALQRLQRAAAGFDAIGDLRGSIRATSALVRAQLAGLDVSAAEQAAARLPEVHSAQDGDEQALESLLALAELRRAQGSSAAAHGLLQVLIASPAAGVAGARFRWSALSLQAQWLLEDGAPPEQVLEAAERVHGSPDAQDDGQLRGVVADAWLAGIRALIAGGRVEAAGRLLADFGDWPGGRDTPRTRASLALARAEHAHALGDAVRATKQYELALEIAESAGSPRLLLDVIRAKVSTLLASPAGAARALGLVDRLGVHPDRNFEAAVLRAQVLQQLGPFDAARAALRIAESLAGERRMPRELQVATAP